MSRYPLIASGILLLLVLAGTVWITGRKKQPVELIPRLSGQAEYCLTCHGDLPEISASHPVDAFGCVVCHGGERLALDADLAHSSLRGGRNPSDPAFVEASCGGSMCHSGEAVEGRDHIQRVMTSLQSTYAGAIASIRYLAGAQPDPDARFGIYSIQDPSLDSPTGLSRLHAFDRSHESSPAVLAFAENCLNCHLAAEPLYWPGSDKNVENARMTGCAACHTPTAGTGYSGSGQPIKPIHRLTTLIAYAQCNICHNRGSYDMEVMQFHPRLERPASRADDMYPPDTLHARGVYELDCIDCHTRQEVMGDGHIYGSQADAQYVQCRTCHGTLDTPPRTRALHNPNDISLRQAFLNPVLDLEMGDTVLVTERDEPLWNIRQTAGGSFELAAKATGTVYPLPLVKGSACEQKPDEQDARYCYACHAIEH